MLGIGAVCVAALLLSKTEAHELVASHGLRLNSYEHNGASLEHQLEESARDGTAGTGGNLVDFLYTYGAPAVAKHPHMSNPGNTCIPGIRAYTEDVNSAGGITNTDFAAHWNAGKDYGHPKISTLVLRWVDNQKVEYYFMECKDSDNKDYYEWEWWPNKHSPALVAPNIHHIAHDYENRLKEILPTVRGPLLEYTHIAWCNAPGYSEQDLKDCLAERFPGYTEVIGYMSHVTEWNGDTDRVYVAKINENPDNQKCIISFEQSDGGTDLSSFMGPNAYTTGYCGRTGVNIGTRNELWQITHDSQYAENIKPALETCHEVTCVGYSLGGALCNVFTMCANQGPENLNEHDDSGMWDDYESLKWTKPV